MSKSTPSTPPKTSPEEITVPFPRVTGLVRQLTHDIRNGLNNIDLQSAYLLELVAEPQAAAEMKRLRGMVGEAAKMLKDFSARFWLPTPNFVKYSARMFMEDFRHRLEKLAPEESPAVEWTVSLREESISVDLEMLSRALMEFFRNGQQFRENGGPMEARVRARDNWLEMELRERKSSVSSPPETWGLEPLVSTRRGGFGMGLFYARQVLEVHGGEVVATFDPEAKQLTTRLSLPIVGT
jgi:signal transduction histidine kinase